MEKDLPGLSDVEVSRLQIDEMKSNIEHHIHC
jgi:hypothetical protein